jgi:hypothetical protein
MATYPGTDEKGLRANTCNPFILLERVTGFEPPTLLPVSFKPLGSTTPATSWEIIMFSKIPLSMMIREAKVSKHPLHSLYSEFFDYPHWF